MMISDYAHGYQKGLIKGEEKEREKMGKALKEKEEENRILRIRIDNMKKEFYGTGSLMYYEKIKGF